MSTSVAWSDPVARRARALVRPLQELRIKAGCLGRLDFLWLEITRSCNLTCGHCYVRSGPSLPVIEKMGLADWCRVIDEAREQGCRRIQFIGGEPTVHPDLWKLIEHAKRAGYRECEVFTNATLIDADSAKMLEASAVRAAFSFYSYDAATHDAITGHSGSFSKTVRGIHALVRHGVRVRAGIVLMDSNAAHLKLTKKYLRRLGVRSIQTDHVRGIGRASRRVDETDPMNHLCGYCWNGKLCVTPEGVAYPCVFSRFAAVGNVLENGVAEIVGGRGLEAFRRRQFLGA